MSGFILVVDDDATLGDGLCEVLELEGFECARAGTALEAVQMASARRPAVVITDFQLPDANGMQVCANIKKLLPETFVIISTGRTLSAADKDQAASFGVDDYAPKPFDVPALAARLKQLLAQTKGI